MPWWNPCFLLSLLGCSEKVGDAISLLVEMVIYDSCNDRHLVHTAVRKFITLCFVTDGMDMGGFQIFTSIDVLTSMMAFQPRQGFSSTVIGDIGDDHAPEVAIADISSYNGVVLNSNIEDNDVRALLHFWLDVFTGCQCGDKVLLWLSACQLLPVFRKVAGFVGFRRHNRKSEWYNASSWVLRHEYDFLVFSRKFQACLKTFAALYGFPFHVQLRKPGGEPFPCWTNSICITVSCKRFLSFVVQLRSLGFGLIKRVQTSSAVIEEWQLGT